MPKFRVKRHLINIEIGLAFFAALSAIPATVLFALNGFVVLATVGGIAITLAIAWAIGESWRY